MREVNRGESQSTVTRSAESAHTARRHERERGVSLLLVLITTSVLSLLAMSLLFISDLEFETSKNHDDAVAVVNELDSAISEVIWRLNLEPGVGAPPSGSRIDVNDMTDFDASLQPDPFNYLRNQKDDDGDGLIDESDELAYNREWVARIVMATDEHAYDWPLVFDDDDPDNAPWGSRQVLPTMQPAASWKEYSSDDPEAGDVLTVRFKLDEDVVGIGDSEGDGSEIVFYDADLVTNGSDDPNTLTHLGFDGNADNDSPYNITWSDGVTVYPATGSPVLLVSTAARLRRAGEVVAEHRVEAELLYPTRPVMGKAICGCTSVDMGSSSLTDSYKSSEGGYGSTSIYENGAIGVNGNLVCAGTVKGDLETSGAISNAGCSTGDATAGAGVSGIPGGDSFPFTLPAPLACPCDAFDVVSLVDAARLDNDNGSLSAECLGPEVKLNGGSTCTLDCGTYYYDKLDTKGNGAIIVGDTSCGPVKIYVAVNMDMAGNGFVNANRPEDLQVYSSIVGPVIDIGGTADFVGVIYAPLADITLRGNADVQGAVLGNTVTGNGGPQVHYDEDLGSVWRIEGLYKLAAWLETEVED